ncbi:MAG: rhomboid family intramembrane serine protease [Alphaproteobacteria bacterium]
MFPLRDHNPAARTPVVTLALLACCVAVFAYQLTLVGENAQRAFVFSYGMIPAHLFGYATLPADLEKVPAELTVITSMFLHGGLFHLGGNMLFLWIFGDNVEDAMGSVAFLLFYISCGIAAAMAQALLTPDSTIPMIGASGAISGILGAYLFLYPTARVDVLVFFGFITILPIPAMVVLGVWFAMQLASGVLTPPDVPGVAFWAHIGGFAAGVLLHRVFGAQATPSRGSGYGRGRGYGGRRGPWG